MHNIVMEKKTQICYDMEVDKHQNTETRPEEIKGTKEWLDKYFPVVSASTLSLKDKILKYEPETNRQKEFKETLVKAIQSGLHDFRAQRLDPSLDEDDNICYKVGKKPAVGKSAAWWDEKTKIFLPEKESRLGFTEERIAFLVLLMKELIEEWGYSISGAWRAVCDESKDLGHYWDSKDAKHYFEYTGNRKVGNWYDLGNTYKITKNKIAGFSLIGGNYYSNSYNYPLGDVFKKIYPFFVHEGSVGWTVLSV